MVQVTRTIVPRALLAILGVATVLLGVFHLLAPLNVALILVIGLLLWRGALQSLAGSKAVPQEALEEFWNLFSRANDPVFLRWDSRFMGTATYKEVNATACRRLGYTREEFLQMRPWDIEVLTEGEKVEEVRTTLAEKGFVYFESTLRTKSGEQYPAEIHVQRMVLGGQPVMLSMARDLTDRKHTEQLMHRLTEAVNQSPVSIIITDKAGVIEFVNPRLAATTGYTVEELLGVTPRIFNSGLTARSVFEELWATVAAGKVWEGELQNKKKSGELFWERATISPITDDQGVITHYLGIKENVTAQKALESQLRHSQKLEAVGQLAGGVAHDFNNILQVINGYGTLIQMTMAEQDPNRNAIGEILKAAERAAHLTHSLLAFSRKQIMNPKTVDLNAVVTNVDKFLRRVIGEDIQLKVIRSSGALPVHVDIGQIEQVLMNLATNARDAMPAGGTLTITTDAISNHGALEQAHGFGKHGRYALVTVTDTGDGMDELTQKRIFDPFFTTKEMGRGTGLGLSIVYGIIKQHGGYITTSSQPGQGTSFELYLPIVHRLQDEEEDPGALPFQVKGTETVLVAEDEPEVRSMVELVLQKYGYNVILAQDGQEAVDLFHAHRDDIQLILMDIIMPRKGGRQAYDEIRKLDPQIKVLFTSGYTADFIRSRGDLEQGMELVLKPFQPLDLLRKMREMLDRCAADPVC